MSSRSSTSAPARKRVSRLSGSAKSFSTSKRRWGGPGIAGLGRLSRLQGVAQVLQGPLLVLVVRLLARPDVGPHPVAGPVPEDVQAVVRLQVVDPHCAGVAGPGEGVPLLGGLAEAIPLVDVVAVPRSGTPVEIQALARGHVLD